MNYTDVINVIDHERILIYEPAILPEGETKPIMLVTHELSRTGAPMMLLETARILTTAGYTVFVLAGQDAPMREDFLEAGATVVIYDLLSDMAVSYSWIESIRDIFRCFFINTISCIYHVNILHMCKARVIWWIHESEPCFKLFRRIYSQLINMPDITICAAGRQVAATINSEWGINPLVLDIGVTDTASDNISLEVHNPVRFLQVGYAYGYKGQEVLCRAIAGLDSSTLARTEFYMCGDTSRANDITDVMNRTSQLFSNVHIIPEMSHNDLLRLYNEVDCVIVPSWFETTSAVMIEGLMSGRICVCTDSCGIASYLTDGSDAYIFHAGDSTHLSQLITHITDSINELSDMRYNGRQIFNQYFSMNVLRSNLLKLIDPIYR